MTDLLASDATQLIDQELVIHAFAPLEGPTARRAGAQIARLWDRCHDHLGMTEPVANTGLPLRPPKDQFQSGPEVPLAAMEDPAADFQAIIRRVGNMLNFSMIFAAPLDTPARRLRIGSAAPPGWWEFDRWWRGLAGAETDALIGVARIFQARLADQPDGPDVSAQGDRPDDWTDVASVLPVADHDPQWRGREPSRANGFAVWEITPDDDRAERQLVLLAPPDQERQLGAWTWTQGDPAIPPFARYLLHAATLRYESRVLAEGSRLDWLATRSADSSGDGEGELITTLTNLKIMRRAVAAIVDNMTVASQPLPQDRRLAEWLPRQLADEVEYLDAAVAEVRLRRQLPPAGPTPASGQYPAHRRSQPNAPAPVPAPRESGVPGTLRGGVTVDPPNSKIELRMGFAIDVCGFSTRPAPGKTEVQDRLAALAMTVLASLGLRLEDTDHQGTGDGMNVFLPASVELHHALLGLVRNWQHQLALDNRRFSDRMRLRLATAVGPVGPAPLGFTGGTIVEVARLLNSKPLRQALVDHPATDLVVMVSDQLYDFVFGQGFADAPAVGLDRCLVKAKEYRKPAWLWIPS